MALIDCPECGHQVSDAAETCPSCGVPSMSLFPLRFFE
jgi:rubrerythrin